MGSKVSHLPKNIPAKEIPLKIKIKGSVSRWPYEGNFVIKVPTTREMSQIGLELAKISDGIPFEMLDKNTAYFNNAIAFLKVVIKDGPAWFVNKIDDEEEEGMDYGLDTLDANVPMEIFKKAEKAVEKWHAALKGQPNEEEAKVSEEQ